MKYTWHILSELAIWNVTWVFLLEITFYVYDEEIEKMGISKFKHFYFLSNFDAVVWIIIIKISLFHIIGTNKFKLNKNLQRKTCKICWTYLLIVVQLHFLFEIIFIQIKTKL